MISELTPLLGCRLNAAQWRSAVMLTAAIRTVLDNYRKILAVKETVLKFKKNNTEGYGYDPGIKEKTPTVSKTSLTVTGKKTPDLTTILKIILKTENYGS